MSRLVYKRSLLNQFVSYLHLLLYLFLWASVRSRLGVKGRCKKLLTDVLHLWTTALHWGLNILQEGGGSLVHDI